MSESMRRAASFFIQNGMIDRNPKIKHDSVLLSIFWAVKKASFRLQKAVVHDSVFCYSVTDAGTPERIRFGRHVILKNWQEA